MDEDGSKQIVIQFNNYINNRDILGLGKLMSLDHVLVNTAGTIISGKEAVLKEWKEFFAQVPDYRNIFEKVTIDKKVVTVRGYSISTIKELSGKAIWKARIKDGKISEWQASENKS